VDKRGFVVAVFSTERTGAVPVSSTKAGSSGRNAGKQGAKNVITDDELYTHNRRKETFEKCRVYADELFNKVRSLKEGGDNARANYQMLYDQHKIACETRNAAQATATRETLRRREAEANLELQYRRAVAYMEELRHVHTTARALLDAMDAGGASIEHGVDIQQVKAFNESLEKLRGWVANY
jgi:hypothetical protein